MSKNNEEALVEFYMNSDLDSLLPSDSAVIAQYSAVANSAYEWDDFN